MFNLILENDKNKIFKIFNIFLLVLFAWVIFKKIKIFKKPKFLKKSKFKKKSKFLKQSKFLNYNLLKKLFLVNMIISMI